MYTSGDYGKKELSRALRNRMTEIYCEHRMTAAEMASIIAHRSATCAKDMYARAIVDFVHMFSDKYRHLVK